MMIIEFQNGEHRDVENEDQARDILEKLYPDAVFGDWEYNEPERQRMLVWENEEIAGEPGTGDDGSHAIAAIIKVEEVA
jgi:hypothetical protein